MPKRLIYFSSNFLHNHLTPFSSLRAASQFRFSDTFTIQLSRDSRSSKNIFAMYLHSQLNLFFSVASYTASDMRAVANQACFFSETNARRSSVATLPACINPISDLSVPPFITRSQAASLPIMTKGCNFNP